MYFRLDNITPWTNGLNLFTFFQITNLVESGAYITINLDIWRNEFCIFSQKFEKDFRNFNPNKINLDYENPNSR
jgi:hypothetical protein